MKTFIANARAAKPNERFVFSQIPPNSREQPEPALVAMIDDDNRRLVDEAAAASTSRSPVFVTDADIIPTTDLWDGTHPKTRGEQKIAAGFVDAFASDLGIGTSCPRAYHAVPMGPRTSPVLSVQPGVGQARLTWTTAPGATGYDVYLTNITRPDASFTKLPFPVAGFVLDRRWAG